MCLKLWVYLVISKIKNKKLTEIIKYLFWCLLLIFLLFIKEIFVVNNFSSVNGHAVIKIEIANKFLRKKGSYS